VSRRAICRCRELGISLPAPSALGDDEAFAGLGKIMNQFTGIAVGYEGANGDKNNPVFAVSPVTLITFAVKTATRSIFWIETKLQKGV